jgi:hypothetical protein
MGASGNSHIRAYIYLGTYMREHKPRIKGCGQVDIFLCDIFVYIFFVDIKNIGLVATMPIFFIHIYALHKRV